MLTVGELFAGIGGIGLGFERAGGGGRFRVEWQVERNKWKRRVLAKHWPGVRRHDDVETFPPADGTDWAVDVITGGFPCVDISIQGKRQGMQGERSGGGWNEFTPIIRTVGPRIVVVENVAEITIRGMDDVLGDLAGMGFNAEWRVLDASDFGVRQARRRMFVVGYWSGENVADADRRVGQVAHERPKLHQEHKSRPIGGEQPVPNGMRIVKRVSDGVDIGRRIAACADAVVPAVAQYVAESILEHEREGNTNVGNH